MNCLGRNKKTISYKNYSAQTPIVDASGNYTGEYEQTYGQLQTEKVYITANQGSASERMFGESVQYDRLLIASNTGIQEHAILWVDASTAMPHDYKVQKIAESLNQVVVAIKKVDVSA